MLAFEPAYAAPVEAFPGTVGLNSEPEEAFSVAGGAYSDQEGIYSDPEGVYNDPEEVYSDPEGAYSDPEGGYFDLGAYPDYPLSHPEQCEGCFDYEANNRQEYGPNIDRSGFCPRLPEEGLCDTSFCTQVKALPVTRFDLQTNDNLSFSFRCANGINRYRFICLLRLFRLCEKHWLV